jgi:hypothetical protein
VPVNPVLTPVESKPAGVELYTVLDSVGSHVQGYPLQANTVTDRAAEGWLAFDVDSHDHAPSAATGAPANYDAVGARRRIS